MHGAVAKGTNRLSIVYAILSAATFSTYTVLTKKFMTKLSGVIQSGISFIIGSVILIVAVGASLASGTLQNLKGGL